MTIANRAYKPSAISIRILTQSHCKDSYTGANFDNNTKQIKDKEANLELNTVYPDSGDNRFESSLNWHTNSTKGGSQTLAVLGYHSKITA